MSLGMGKVRHRLQTRLPTTRSDAWQFHTSITVLRRDEVLLNSGEHNTLAEQLKMHEEEVSIGYPSHHPIVPMHLTSSVPIWVYLVNQQVHKAHGITDPLLTDLGRTQATSLAIALQRETSRGMPMPEKWFVSPLKRCGETCGLEWGWAFQTTTGGASKDMGHGVKATVVEVSHSAACLAFRGASSKSSMLPGFASS